MTGVAAPRAFILGNAAFVVAMVAVAAWAAWPIYRDWHVILLVVVSLALGLIVAWVGSRRRLSWLTVALIAVGVYLVVGVPLAVPTALTDPVAVLHGWIDLVAGSVFGWKELVTVSLPVGDYQALLVPALVVFLFGTVAAGSIAWRSSRLWFLTAAVGIAMQSFGLFFGSSALSTGTALGFVTIAAPRELVVGGIGFLVSLGFLLWRVAFARRQAILAAQATAGIRQRSEPRASIARRAALAAAVLVIAIAVAASLSPALASGSRGVLRASIEPRTAKILEASPLSQYRDYFKSGYDTDLFSVTTTGTSPVRLRLATLSYYDGQFFRATDPATPGGTEDSAFVRIPSRLSPSAAGTEQKVTVTVGDYAGPWLPTAGELVRASFSGPDSAALADGFYYNSTVGAALDVAPLSKGDSYALDVVIPDEKVGLSSITAPTTATTTIDSELIPKQLVAWARAQGAGLSLSELVSRLRERGFMSHSVDSPDTTTQPWVAGLAADGPYAWSPSAAGHSIDRIDSLFAQLLQRQQQRGAGSDDLVAGVGDDEQFSVAVALLARYLGYTSRVVLGFTTTGETSADNEIPSCATTCKGQNLTAWAEVQDGASGEWVTVDSTPQHTRPLAADRTTQRNPQVPTIVQQQSATQEDPPAESPSDNDSTSQQDAPERVDLAWLVTLLRTVGLSLLVVVVVLAPFATILVAKARRRRGRMRSSHEEERIVGGWDEFVDTAIDHGYAVAPAQTRSQVAATFRTPNGGVLAMIADEAVFGPVDPDRASGDAFWTLLDDERLALARGMNRWQRLRATFSLRSFTRYLRPAVRPATKR